MYRILIIDDEPVVREGISETIDWNAHGFELVGACRDGREALLALERSKPDVVLTDICMPFVDGLELAAWIGEEDPTTRTILLTGYDEFEYAQEAVKLRVDDFLLKPITAEELRTLLDTVRLELDEERNRRDQLDRIHAQLAESVPLLRERFLNRLVRVAVDRGEASHKLKLLDITLPGPAYIAFVCDRDVGTDEDDFAVFAIQDVVERTIREFPEAIAFCIASIPSSRSDLRLSFVSI